MTRDENMRLRAVLETLALRCELAAEAVDGLTVEDATTMWPDELMAELAHMAETCRALVKPVAALEPESRTCASCAHWVRAQYCDNGRCDGLRSSARDPAHVVLLSGGSGYAPPAYLVTEPTFACSAWRAKP